MVGRSTDWIVGFGFVVWFYGLVRYLITSQNEEFQQQNYKVEGIAFINGNDTFLCPSIPLLVSHQQMTSTLTFQNSCPPSLEAGFSLIDIIQAFDTSCAGSSLLMEKEVQLWKIE